MPRIEYKDRPGEPPSSFPSTWLAIRGAKGVGDPCLSFEPVFSRSVTFFEIGNRLLGLRISAYRPARPGEGSMQLACGHDIMLLREPGTGEVTRSEKGVGPGKEEHRVIVTGEQWRSQC